MILLLIVLIDMVNNVIMNTKLIDGIYTVIFISEKQHMSYFGHVIWLPLASSYVHTVNCINSQFVKFRLVYITVYVQYTFCV